ncbi:uncharacterized protein LOC143442436 [Arvicanthis niloticus]|uniref:uncharacterized protein LOC143312674 n=1 Tax=Arvicanthis niloticus TaxID=61156 RepID=UPI00402B1A3A
MAQTEERVVRGLTGSPRAEEAGGGSGDLRAEPLRSSGRSEVEGRVGNRGGDRARSRQRRAPALPARERVPASPGPAPSASTPSRGLAGLQGALFPPSPLRPAPPPVPRRACAPPAPSVEPAFAGTRALCFPLRDSPSCEPAGLPASRTQAQALECCWLEVSRPQGTFEVEQSCYWRAGDTAGARQGTRATSMGQGWT